MRSVRIIGEHTHYTKKAPPRKARGTLKAYNYFMMEICRLYDQSGVYPEEKKGGLDASETV